MVSSVTFYEDHWKCLLYFFFSRLQFLSFGVHSWALDRGIKPVTLKCSGHSKLLKNFTVIAAKAEMGGAQSWDAVKEARKYLKLFSAEVTFQNQWASESLAPWCSVCLPYWRSVQSKPIIFPSTRNCISDSSIL